MSRVFYFLIFFILSIKIPYLLQAQDEISTFLMESSPEIPRKMLVGSGSYYGVDDPQIFTFDIESKVNPKMVGDITKSKRTSKIPSNTFDIVEFEYLPTDLFKENAEKTFAEMRRILKKGGYLKFNDMTEWTTGRLMGPFTCPLTSQEHFLITNRHDTPLGIQTMKDLEDKANEITALFFFKLGFTWIKKVENHWYLFK
jgi:SAM-dependent methyltransferase